MVNILINLIKFFEENKVLGLLFVFSTLFFIYQHSIGIQWDFASYTLNAKYLFDNGNYFEWYRSPLTSFLIGIFTLSVIPFWIAEYIYILFVSSLFLLACIKFSDSFGLNKTLFYVLILNPFTILTGVALGTELLSLSFLLLFLSYLFSDKPFHEVKSGFSMAFTCLSRYTCFPYSILILFSKKIKGNYKSILILILIISLTFIPWFIFNYYKTGHFLTSIADSQALNIKYRDYMIQEASVLHFLIVGNFLIPFFFLGIKNFKFSRKNITIILFLIISIFIYAVTPVKEPRYLFNLILPFAYFSYPYIEKIKNSEIIFSSVGIITLLSLILLSFSSISVEYLNQPEKEFYDLNLPKNCTLSSNRWVPLNYVGYTSEPPPREQEINSYIERGHKLVIYYIGEPDYSKNVSFLREFPVIMETGNYIILGDKSKCNKPYTIDSTYLENLNNTVFNLYNYSIETNPCRSLSFGLLCGYLKFL